MRIVFLVEELSMKHFLDLILPQILPGMIGYLVVPHQGKQDLHRSIPIKLRSWREPNVRFVVVQDKDSWDCRELKQEISQLCVRGGRPDTLVRIACNEMESWYFGDLEAVGQAYNIDIAQLSRKRKFRNPDSIENPKAELRKIIKELQQISGAKKIAHCMNIRRNTSHSFQVFIEGVSRISQEMLE